MSRHSSAGGGFVPPPFFFVTTGDVAPSFGALELSSQRDTYKAEGFHIRL